MAKSKKKSKKTVAAKITDEAKELKASAEQAAKDDYDFGDDLDTTDVLDEPAVAEPPKQEKEEEKEAEAPVGISDDLLTRAVKAGMTIAEARSLGTDEALTTALVAIERAGSKAVERTTSTTEAIAPVDDFKLELDPDLYEPEVLAAFDGIKKHGDARLAAMQAKMDSVLDELQSQRQQDSEKRVDGMFDGLGGDWAAEFGEGPTSSLRKNSVHAKNRAKVTDHMAMMEAGAKALGKDSPDDLFHKTVESVFSEHNQELADTATRTAAADRAGQSLVPPTRQDGKPLSREAQAVANVRDRMTDSGMDPIEEDYDYDEETAGFPE